MDKYHQLFYDIHFANNLGALRVLNIKGYDESQVPVSCNHSLIEKK
jgi:hypothetical protein